MKTDFHGTYFKSYLEEISKRGSPQLLQSSKHCRGLYVLFLK